MESSDLRIQVITDLASFKVLRQAWDDLYGAAVDRYPTVSHRWLLAWWEAFGQDASLYVIAWWRGNELICGAPLLYRSCYRLGKSRKVLSLFTNSWVDRSTILVRDGEEHYLRVIVDHLVNDAPYWDLLELDRLDAAADITKRLQTLLNEHRVLVGAESSLQSPYLVLPKSWKELLQLLSPSFRQTVQRKCRKAQKLSNMRLSIRTDPGVSDAIMAISLQSWQHDAGTSMASTPQIRQFYEAIIDDAANSGTLFVGIMEVDDLPIAFEFNIVCGQTLHNFKLGYRKDCADWSPGIVLKAFVLEKFINECAKQHKYSAEYDFMGTNEPYKRNWSKAVREHVLLKGFARNWDLAIIHYWLYRLKPGLRKLFPWLGRIEEAVFNALDYKVKEYYLGSR